MPDAIAARDHRQDRFVERSADDFDPPLGRQFGQPVDVLRVLGRQPFEQAAARVERDLEVGRVAGKDVQERLVALLVRLLDDAVEVADRLVVMQRQNQADGIRHDLLSRGA